MNNGTQQKLFQDWHLSLDSGQIYQWGVSGRDFTDYLFQEDAIITIEIINDSLIFWVNELYLGEAFRSEQLTYNSVFVYVHLSTIGDKVKLMNR